MQRLSIVTFLFCTIFLLENCKIKPKQEPTPETKTTKPTTPADKNGSTGMVATFSILEDSLTSNKIAQAKDSCYECGITIDVSANWLDITYPNGSTQRLKFKNQRGPKYGLTFQVKTNLKKNENIIYDYYYRPITGGVTDTKKLGVTLDSDCENWTVNYYLYTGQKKMTGKFGICYTKLN